MLLTVGKYPRVKTLRRLVFPQAPSPIITNFLILRKCQYLICLYKDVPRPLELEDLNVEGQYSSNSPLTSNKGIIPEPGLFMTVLSSLLFEDVSPLLLNCCSA